MKKNYKSAQKLFFILFSLSAFSQNIDEDFLKSLPENLENEIQGTVEERKKDAEKEGLPNPDTRIENLESSLESAENLLKKIKDELALSDQLNQDKRFGSKFFNTFQSTFMPINSPNFDSNYILDVGDLLLIQIVGQEKEKYEVEVLRDGSISIPKIGKVFVAGLSSSEAFRKIIEIIDSTLVGSQTFVSLINLRDISVLITGNINNPGAYTLRGGANFLTLILAGGGIDSLGSYRNIEHRRDGEIIEKIDLYELFVEGRFRGSSILRSGDVLVIKPKLKEVKVSGSNITNPAIFEIKDNEGVDDLLRFAGARFQDTIQNYKLTRFDKKLKSLSTLEFSSNDVLDIDLQDGDSLILGSFQADIPESIEVTIAGEINLPGKYTLQINTPLSELLEMAGGYNSDAYIFASSLHRKSSSNIQDLLSKQKVESLLVTLFGSKVIGSSSGGVDFRTIEYIFNLISENKDYGRVIAEFDIDILKDNKDLDLLLENGDKILISSVSKHVHVLGAVNNPSTLRFNSTFQPQDYIEDVGGINTLTGAKEVIHILPNGQSEYVTLDNNFLKLRKQNFDIYPGSILYVPTTFSARSDIENLAVVAPILSSLTLAVASLNSLNN